MFPKKCNYTIYSVTLGSVIISAQVMTSNYTTNSDIESILKETPIELTFVLNVSLKKYLILANTYHRNHDKATHYKQKRTNISVFIDY